MSSSDIRRDEFAALIASGASLSEAAERVGITANTATRWARHPDVIAQLEKYRNEVRASTGERLTAFTTRALDRAEHLLEDVNCPPAVIARLLSIGLTETRAWLETEEIMQRIEALEASRTGPDRYQRKPTQ